ncbi:hypothetical protein F2Q70_00036835 [Brassica cretica]|uniref:Uncharacterized protein n=1 Tax=Brassica cretica TaxID=69181 RepID=A0A8S9GHH6_BRACR|nr:hypothetical protein F2Q68_00032160 [Brassica cretica]KAF2586462.1 hypothetical protein F2Q70_00036835 [Brassica cretica]
MLCIIVRPFQPVDLRFVSHGLPVLDSNIVLKEVYASIGPGDKILDLPLFRLSCTVFRPKPLQAHLEMTVEGNKEK